MLNELHGKRGQNMLVPEQTLTLDLLPLSADTARLVRVYGTEPCLALPGTLPARSEELV